MTEILNNAGAVLGVLTVLAFAVNIIVQLTKEFIPLPTKLWVILVSATVMLAVLFAAASHNMLELGAVSIALSLIGSFVVAYAAMYGFDTLKELWERFKGGDNINDDN